VMTGLALISASLNIFDSLFGALSDRLRLSGKGDWQG
jgi:hypothetical protein